MHKLAAENPLNPDIETRYREIVQFLDTNPNNPYAATIIAQLINFPRVGATKVDTISDLMTLFHTHANSPSITGACFHAVTHQILFDESIRQELIGITDAIFYDFCITSIRLSNISPDYKVMLLTQFAPRIRDTERLRLPINSWLYSITPTCESLELFPLLETLSTRLTAEENKQLANVKAAACKSLYEQVQKSFDMKAERFGDHPVFIPLSKLLEFDPVTAVTLVIAKLTHAYLDPQRQLRHMAFYYDWEYKTSSHYRPRINEQVPREIDQKYYAAHFWQRILNSVFRHELTDSQLTAAGLDLNAELKLAPGKQSWLYEAIAYSENVGPLAQTIATTKLDPATLVYHVSKLIDTQRESKSEYDKRIRLYSRSSTAGISALIDTMCRSIAADSTYQKHSIDATLQLIYNLGLYRNAPEEQFAIAHQRLLQFYSILLAKGFYPPPRNIKLQYELPELANSFYFNLLKRYKNREADCKQINAIFDRYLQGQPPTPEQLKYLISLVNTIEEYFFNDQDLRMTDQNLRMIPEGVLRTIYESERYSVDLRLRVALKIPLSLREDERRLSGLLARCEVASTLLAWRERLANEPTAKLEEAKAEVNAAAIEPPRIPSASASASGVTTPPYPAVSSRPVSVRGQT